MNIAISLIAPIYNVEAYLPRFFDSIKQQTFKDFEVILVDDGSTDNSYKACQDFAKKDERVQVVHQENQGTGNTRNKGMSLAKGKYIYFADPDDHFEPNLLKDNYLLAEKYKANVVFFNYALKCKTGKLIRKNKMKRCFYETKSDVRDNFPTIYNEGLGPSVWNKLFLKESLKGIQFENIKIGEDLRFNLEYYVNLSRVYCNPKIYYYYVHNREDSATNQDRFSMIYYQIGESKLFKKLVYDYWHKENNPKFQQFIKDRYLGTAITALRLGENVHNKRRIAAIDRMIQKNYGQYIKFSWKNSIKDNYYVVVLRLRHVPLILHLDKVIFWIVKGRKNG